jgi:hypothetical protein
VAGVLDEPYSQLGLSGVAVRRPASLHRQEPCPVQPGGPVRLLCRAGLADYKVRLKLPPQDTKSIKRSVRGHTECPKQSSLHRGGIPCNKDIIIITKKVIVDFERSSFLPK